jgi:hypothetical protein
MEGSARRKVEPLHRAGALLTWDQVPSCVSQLIGRCEGARRLCHSLYEARIGRDSTIHAVLSPILLPQVRNSTSSVSVFMSLSEIEYIDLVHLALAPYLVTHGGSQC